MQRLYESVGIEITTKGHNHNGGFRLEPSKRVEFEGYAFPFGEAAGMNSPEHGQLADLLPIFSHVLAELLLNASTTSFENTGLQLYDYWKKNPPFSYFLHSILRENRQISPHLAILLKKATAKALSPIETWEILQKSGMSTEQMVRIFLGAPLEMFAWSLANIPNAIKVALDRPDLLI